MRYADPNQITSTLWIATVPRAVLALLMILAFPFAASAQQPRGVDVLSIYRDVNEMCRSSTGNDLHRIAACNLREKVGRLLNSMGYCFGHQGQDEAERQWHKCVGHELF